MLLYSSKRHQRITIFWLTKMESNYQGHKWTCKTYELFELRFWILFLFLSLISFQIYRWNFLSNRHRKFRKFELYEAQKAQVRFSDYKLSLYSCWLWSRRAYNSFSLCVLLSGNTRAVSVQCNPKNSVKFPLSGGRRRWARGGKKQKEISARWRLVGGGVSAFDNALKRAEDNSAAEHWAVCVYAYVRVSWATAGYIIYIFDAPWATQATLLSAPRPRRSNFRTKVSIKQITMHGELIVFIRRAAVSGTPPKKVASACSEFLD